MREALWGAGSTPSNLALGLVFQDSLAQRTPSWVRREKSWARVVQGSGNETKDRETLIPPGFLSQISGELLMNPPNSISRGCISIPPGTERI